MEAAHCALESLRVDFPSPLPNSNLLFCLPSPTTPTTQGLSKLWNKWKDVEFCCYCCWYYYLLLLVLADSLGPLSALFFFFPNNIHSSPSRYKQQNLFLWLRCPSVRPTYILVLMDFPLSWLLYYEYKIQITITIWFEIISISMPTLDIDKK